MNRDACWKGALAAGALAALAVGGAAPPAEAQIVFGDTRFTPETIATFSANTVVGLTWAPDGRMFIWQRDGIVRIRKDGTVLSTPFLNISAQVNRYWDHGLLGLALDPNFAVTGHVFLLYTYEPGPDPNDNGPKTARLTRVTADPASPDVALPGSELIIIDNIPSEGLSHSIGSLRFATDGTLFVSVGDAASFGFVDPLALRAQDLNSLAGKILRINPDGTAPADNPFYDGTDSVRSKVYAYGLRNPFRFGLHPVTNEPYIGDVGWSTWEEVNTGRGANFGWPCYEGPNPQPGYQSAFTQCQQLAPAQVRQPLYTYGRSVGSTAIGGAFYTGERYPVEYRGNFFFADYSARWIDRVVFDASGTPQFIQQFAAGFQGPTAIEHGPDGLLYVVEFNAGRITRINYNGPLAKASATPTSGYSPLSVQFSSAGSQGSGDLSYSWAFGDGATSTQANPSHTYVVSGVQTFTATLTVTASGSSASDSVTITVGSTPPTPVISSPPDGAPVAVGDTITFTGSATDPDQGSLPPSALEWTVLLHHNNHVHPIQSLTGTGGSQTVEDHGAGIFSYEFVLTARDSSGLSRSVSVTAPVEPRAVTGLAFSPDTVVGGSASTGTITLSIPAGPAGETVQLSSSSPDVQVPLTVSVPSGATTVTFLAGTSVVPAPITALVTATLNGSVTASLTVNPAGGLTHLAMNYADRSAFLADGWDFIARTATGGSRNTEQTGSLAVSYNQGGNLRVPLGTGEVWQAINNSQNHLFRNLPSDWVSLRLKIASFNPDQNYRQVGLMAYQDDDNYVVVSRAFVSGSWVEFFSETAQATTPQQRSPLTNTGNLILRLDRNASTNTYIAFYSTNDGAAWVQLPGSVTRTLTNPRIGIQAGANLGGPVAADLAWVEILRPASLPTPSLTSINPTGGARGETTNVVLGGSNFAGGATCSFGVGITVNSCTLNSASQITANITISPTATLGARTVTVTNPDNQSASLANAFTVSQASAPTVTGVSPTGGAQGDDLTVAIAGQNFLGGATCSFGAGITVTACNLVSSSQLSASISISFSATVGSRTVTVNNPDGQSASLADAFTVQQGSTGPTHIDFTYPDRNALLAGGWDFLARTAAGATRNTEQTDSLAVDYNQTTHPGRVRIPLGSGEIWSSLNNSQNTLFRDLPSDWTSIRLRIAAFNPTANYQQLGLLAYVNDDTYVNLNRAYIDGAKIELFRESAQSVTLASRFSLSNTGNLILRLDRNASTNTYTGLYSTDGGASWTTVGSTTLALASPRLGIQVGASPPGTTPVADLEWVEVFRQGGPVAPTVVSATPNSGSQGQTLNVILTGGSFQSGATCNFGAGITVTGCVFNASTQLTATIAISPTATLGARSVTVTNPDGQSGTLTNGFTVLTVPAPAVTSLSPTSGAQGQSVSVAIGGSGFQQGASCSFGAGITVGACTYHASTQLIANVTIASNATLGTRTVVVTNPDDQTGGLPDSFTVAQATGGQTGDLTVAVLVNSNNPAGYDPSPQSPGTFQRYLKLYLDHLQAPFDIIDVATTAPPANLSSRHLIIAGHAGLNPSGAWQTAITTAVNNGTGFVNMDTALSIGGQTHIENIFGATGATSGAAASSIRVPAAVVPGGSSPHWIAALQRRFLGDPTGDIVYNFHPDQGGVTQTISPVVLTGATGTVIAQAGGSTLILARTFGAGRAVNFGSNLYLSADRFGFVQGVDDLFWRSLVWAARKPFVLRGYPRFWSVQMDDTMPGWIGRVRDMYDPALTGSIRADGTGGPWKVTGYLFTNNAGPGTAERAGIIADIQAGKLRVSPHSFTNVKYGDMFWNTTVGQLTDQQWQNNLAAIQAWLTGNGGNDAIPSLSRSLVGHYWDLSNNIGDDLWNALGIRYITAIQKPGVRYPDQLTDITAYTGDGSERLHVESYWPHELPPKTRPDENYPFFFADDYTIGSRAGLPSRTFFLFASQYIDFARYPRPDFIWPSTQYAQSVASSLDHLQRYTWRHWSGFSPVQIYTHDVVNYEYATAPERQAVIAQASQWLADNGARHAFMDELGDYLYARNKSILTRVQLAEGSLQFTFTGSAATADGALVPTQAFVFYQDAEGVPVTLAGFSAPTTLSALLPAPPPMITSVTPGSGTEAGGTAVTISGSNFVSVTSVRFGTASASFTVQGPTSIQATTPPGAGTVDVAVVTATGAASVTGGFTYTAPPPAAGHFDFDYPSRSDLLNDGWSFLARTATGATRDTEQTGSLAVDYNQTTHPGRIRIPLGAGEMWSSLNSSQNTLFRALPSNWTSIRLRIASFSPAANYQQVGLGANGDDDNYVIVNRVYVNGGMVEVFREIGQSPALANRLSLANTGDLILRLDRNAATNTYTGFYSTNGGSSWTTIGSTTAVLTNPRLFVQVGANLAGGTPTADLEWVEIIE
jgi:glucose/arabinose dehydrogenase